MFYVTFTGSELGIDGLAKLKMVPVILPVKSKLTYVALIIQQLMQIARIL